MSIDRLKLEINDTTDSFSLECRTFVAVRLFNPSVAEVRIFLAH